jgi:N-acetylneuraminic acid mutarotase
MTSFRPRKVWIVLVIALCGLIASVTGAMAQAPAGNGASGGAGGGQGRWTWMGGSNVSAQKGIYGTQGVADAGNVPGARNGPAYWMDAAGNFWIFGGQGFDSTGEPGPLNDLWKYSAGQWTWMGGSNVTNQQATYGTEGTAAVGNVPGARGGVLQWTDAAGNVWLFGGIGNDSSGTMDYLDDLWEYSAGQWAWMGGSNVVNRAGTYGAQGAASASNVPGGRGSAATWTDAAGNFWVFGGHGYDSPGSIGYLNDLWKYSAGQWTWMGGSNVANQKGKYGTEGTAAAGNVPGARDICVSWTDAAGNFWLFGGDGYDSQGNWGDLNDLWKYSAGEWTWMGGSNVVNQKGIYGTQRTAAAGNVPGARGFSVAWTDTAGNSWLFGGYGYDSTGATLGFLNDLWKYSAGEWTWVSGSNVGNQKGAAYGTQGIADAANVPGGRGADVIWTDAAGNLWLFGGGGYDSAGATGYLNDLWRYGP